MIRPGQHVSGDGKVYHPYLAHWREAWEVSWIPGLEHSVLMEGTTEIQHRRFPIHTF